jgi:hypothetical protein
VADNTSQGGLDTIATDELVTQNGVSVSGAGIKVQRVKPGYGLPDDFTDVSVQNGLPVDSSESLMQTVVLNSAAASGIIDTTGFSWISVQVGTGMVGQTALVMQASNDIAFPNPVNAALSPAGSTGSGITTALGIVNGIFTGPIPARYIRFLPTGFTSGTQTLLLYMQSMSSQMPSIGANAAAAITSFSTGVAPAISNSPLALGTGTGNAFQVRATGSADQAATSILGAVAAQMPYVTEIYCSTWGAAAGAAPTPRRFQVIGAASALLEHNLVCPPNDCVERKFRHPWKPFSAINQVLNVAVTSMVAAASGNWEILISGYYATS